MINNELNEANGFDEPIELNEALEVNNADESVEQAEVNKIDTSSEQTTVQDFALNKENQKLVLVNLRKTIRPSQIGKFVNYESLNGKTRIMYFECLTPGYPEWLWAVPITKIDKNAPITINEIYIEPPKNGFLVPKSFEQQNKKNNIVSPKETIKKIVDDRRLEPGYNQKQDDSLDKMSFFELGLGRKRVISAFGREQASSRWRVGASGSMSQYAKKAKAKCASCGFSCQISGAFRTEFGVCANENSPFDGRIVSYDCGCGAHSETDTKISGKKVGKMLIDDTKIEIIKD